MLLLGVLLVLPPGLAMLPVWLAGRPPFVVVPEAAEAPEAGAFAAPPWPAVPPAPAEPGAAVPPVDGAPDASGAGTPPLKPLLPPAGLSPAEGVRAGSVPVAAAGAAPDPVLPGVFPASLLPCLPQALKARVKARARKPRPPLGMSELTNECMSLCSRSRWVDQLKASEPGFPWLWALGLDSWVTLNGVQRQLAPCAQKPGERSAV